MNEPPVPDAACRAPLRTGWLLLAFFLPLGLSLEALHALKVEVYLGSALRRELWTLAHAHGNLLGMLCLLFAALGAKVTADDARRRRLGLLLSTGAVMMPLGFLFGGVMNSEGDPSLAIVLVPLGGLVLLVALLGAARAAFSATGTP